MTTYVLAQQARIAQEWITREGLAVAVGSGCIVTPDVAQQRLWGIGVHSTVLVLETPNLGPWSMAVEDLLSQLAQTRVTIVRLNPDTQHGDVHVRPVEPDFTPPDFESAEEALAWLEKMDNARKEFQERLDRQRNGGDVRKYGFRPGRKAGSPGLQAMITQADEKRFFSQAEWDQAKAELMTQEMLAKRVGLPVLRDGDSVVITTTTTVE